MALSFPSSPTTGQTYTDPNSVVWTYDGVKWFVSTGSSKKMFSGTKIIRQQTAFNLSATPTAIPFDTEYIDVDNYFNPINPTRIVIPANGFYRINATIFTSAAGTSFVIEGRRNNVVVSTTIINGNQATNYDEVLQLNAGDYLELCASESSATGSLLTGTFIEVTQIGLTMGSSVTPFQAFSGVRVIRSTTISTTTTPTAVAWTSASFNENADILGNPYWVVGTPTRITIKTAGYYRMKSFIQTGAQQGSYTVTIRKNGSTVLSTGALQANNSANLDEIYNFAANDYVELLASDNAGVGTLTTSTYLELIRLGV